MWNKRIWSIGIILMALAAFQFNWSRLIYGPVVVSKETTFMTEPIRSDGGIDYFTALNREMSHGVTHENNALVDLLRVLPIKNADPLWNQGFVEQLGLSGFPDEFKYLERPDHYMYKQQGGTVIREVSEEIVEMYERLRAEPWTSQQFPDWQKWIDEFDDALDVVVEASHKERFYYPFVKLGDLSEQTLLATLLNAVHPMQDSCRMLQLRAMNSLGEGDVSSALEDTLAIFRMGELSGQTVSLIELLAQINIDNMAFETTQLLMEYGALNETQLRKLTDELQQRAPAISVAERFDCGERCMTLDALQMTNIYNIDAAGNPKTNSIANWFIDWNEASRVVNQCYDRCVACLEQPVGKTRKESLIEFEAFMREMTADPQELTWREKMGPRARGRAIGRIFIGLMMPDFQMVVDAESEAFVRTDLLHLGIALEKYKIDVGNYPQELAELVPEYIDSIPGDRCSHEPLRYRRTPSGYLLYAIGVDGIDDGGRIRGESNIPREVGCGDLRFRVGNDE